MVRGSEGTGVVTVAGRVVGVGSAAFLVRGDADGTVMFLGRAAVVVGSAAFFVRGTAGLGVVTGLSTGESVVGAGFEAWAMPEAVMPPPMMVRAVAAARAGRSFVMKTN